MQNLRQKKELKKHCMLDQKRRHEVNINLDCLDDYPQIESDAISVFKGCLYAFAITATSVCIALLIAVIF